MFYQQGLNLLTIKNFCSNTCNTVHNLRPKNLIYYFLWTKRPFSLGLYVTRWAKPCQWHFLSIYQKSLDFFHTSKVSICLHFPELMAIRTILLIAKISSSITRKGSNICNWWDTCQCNATNVQLSFVFDLTKDILFCTSPRKKVINADGIKILMNKVYSSKVRITYRLELYH